MTSDSTSQVSASSNVQPDSSVSWRHVAGDVIVDGGAWLCLGFVGFLVWAVFLVITGIALITGRSAAPTPAPGPSVG